MLFGGLIEAICRNEAYKAGNSLHGCGHARVILAVTHIPEFGLVLVNLFLR
jgi:hypothetical protein